MVVAVKYADRNPLAFSIIYYSRRDRNEFVRLDFTCDGRLFISANLKKSKLLPLNNEGFDIMRKKASEIMGTLETYLKSLPGGVGEVVVESRVVAVRFKAGKTNTLKDLENIAYFNILRHRKNIREGRLSC